MIPGIVAFSAHYFWFLLQIGCHCFTKTLRNIKSDHRTNALLFFIDNEIHCFHVNVKQLCRLYVTLSSLAYIGFYASKDLLNCLIVPSGQVPLTLMWGLHLFHLLGLALHVGLTVCSNWTKTSEAMKVWAPPSSEDLQTQDADEPPLANEDTGDRTIAAFIHFGALSQRQSEKIVQEPLLYTTNHTKTEKNSSIIPRQTLIHSCRPLTRWWSSEASWCSNAK
ncbi:unnamed protein product [Rotaria sordida]|uniref:Uncharacterized protein n=1 Tax=Rotaria sordida TaxID=392033 RepID=A0A814P3Q4_9BILA|nr:unnamed protein product [Rotaria sordida]